MDVEAFRVSLRLGPVTPNICVCRSERYNVRCLLSRPAVGLAQGGDLLREVVVDPGVVVGAEELGVFPPASGAERATALELSPDAAALAVGA